jgi:hypothetical protein
LARFTARPRLHLSTGFYSRDETHAFFRLAFNPRESLLGRLRLVNKRIVFGETQGLFESATTFALAHIEDFLPFLFRANLTTQRSMMGFREAQAIETPFSEAFA